MNPSHATRIGSKVLAYVGFVHVLALIAAVWCFRSVAQSADVTAVQILFWLVFTLSAELFWLETPTGDGMISMSLAANIATLFVLPSFAGVAVIAGATLIADLVIHRRGPLKATFNMSQMMITAAVCVALVRILGDRPAVTGGSFLLHHPLASLLGPVLFFMVNTGLVAGVIGLQTGDGPLRAWKDNYGTRYQFLSSATLSLLGILLVVSVGAIGYISGLLYLLFFFFVRDAYNRWAQSRRAERGRETGAAVS